MVLLPIFITLLLIHVSRQHSIHPRIVNGEDAQRDLFRFMALLETYPVILPFTAEDCAGVAIDKDWILSSARCIKRITKLNSKGRAKVGKFFTFNDDEDVQVIEIDFTIVHEQYSSTNFLNIMKVDINGYWIFDIGLAHLAKSIEQPVLARLAPKDISPTGEVVIAGWGKTSSREPKVLQSATLPLATQDYCTGLIEKGGVMLKVETSQLCMHSNTESVTGYRGDSGGPMLQFLNGEPVVVGIMSWTGYPWIKKEVPSLGSSVPYFRTWIDEKMKTKKPKTSISSMTKLIHSS